MANDPVEIRLPLVMHKYLEELACLGAFGSTKTAVARSFIEQGVQKALADELIEKRSISAESTDG
jgi:hypothetical protein